jgi:hypothetical protein
MKPPLSRGSRSQRNLDICYFDSLFSPNFFFGALLFVCCVFFAVVVAVAPAHGGEWFCEVGRCVVKTNSMPLLWIPLTKRMAVSDTASWTLCFDANSMPLLQLLLAATGVVVDCYLPSSGFEEIVQAWTWLHSTPAMGADGNSSRQRERYRRTPQIWGDV